MTTAIYVRVSSKSQDTASQDRELSRWADSRPEEPVVWYKDKATGTTMTRPNMDRLLADVRSGVITKIVVWRLDRLGRTARGMLELFEELAERKVGFVSLRDSIDLSTPSGRLMVGVLSSMAQYETEIRSERQLAGIAAAREKNGGKCPWGGRKVGQRVRVTPEKERVIREMSAANRPISEIARVVELSRPTVYSVLGSEQ